MVAACEDFRRKRQEFGGMRGQCFPDSLWGRNKFYFPQFVTDQYFSELQHGLHGSGSGNF